MPHSLTAVSLLRNDDTDRLVVKGTFSRFTVGRKCRFISASRYCAGKGPA